MNNAIILGAIKDNGTIHSKKGIDRHGFIPGYNDFETKQAWRYREETETVYWWPRDDDLTLEDKDAVKKHLADNYGVEVRHNVFLDRNKKDINYRLSHGKKWLSVERIKIKDIIKEMIGKNQVGKWAYHKTKIENLPSIQKEGLKASKFRYGKLLIFFSSNTKNWPVLHPAEHIMLRFPWPEVYGGPFDVPYMGEFTAYEFITKKTIPPKNIQINVSNETHSTNPKWVDLTKLDLTKLDLTKLKLIQQDATKRSLSKLDLIDLIKLLNDET